MKTLKQKLAIFLSVSMILSGMMPTCAAPLYSEMQADEAGIYEDISEASIITVEESENSEESVADDEATLDKESVADDELAVDEESAEYEELLKDSGVDPTRDYLYFEATGGNVTVSLNWKSEKQAGSTLMCRVTC